MADLALELEEARNSAGTEYCTSCFVRGQIEGKEPSVVEMEVRWSLLGENPYREDIQLKCPECKTTRQKGIGLSKNEFERKLERRDGNKFLDLFDIKDAVEEVNEGLLKSLGYKAV